MKTVYIETSIVSYLRSRPSAQVVTVARQVLTRRWWDRERGNYQLITSQYVLDEAGRGNQDLAADRVANLHGIPLLDLPPDIPELASRLLSSAVLPPNARLDALHICASAFHGLDYLLTWNCSHIANARLLPRVRDVLLDLGYLLPTVCTPEEMLDDEEDIE